MKMKHLLITAALISSSVCVAQDAAPAEETVLKSKKGHEILPKEGDIALGFNTVPMIDFLLNSIRYVSLFGGTPPTASNQAGNAIQYTSNTSNQIVGKYYLDSKTAIRARVGLNSVAGSFVSQVQDAEAMHLALQGTQDDVNAAMLLRVEDKMKYNKKNLLLAVGYEKRRGYNRLQGFYGGEFGIGRTSAHERSTFGNAFSDVYNTDYTSNFSAGTVSTQTWNSSTRVSRTLERDYRSVWTLGLRGFIGIEYFFLPKISVGAEYGWGFTMSSQKGRTDVNEVYFNGQNGPTVIQEEVNSDNSSKTRGFSVDNNNTSFANSFSGGAMNTTSNGSTSLGGGAGSLTLLFHF